MSKKSKPPVALYSALADSTRCKIIEILLTGPIPVHTLADAFAISRPAISRHLRVLKTAGLVAEVKKGRENLYAFKPQKLDAAKAWLELVRPSAMVAEAAAAVGEPSVIDDAEPIAIRIEPEVALEPVVDAVPVKPRKQKAAARDEAAKPSEAKTAKAKKPAPEPVPDINQMGFDF